MEFHDGICDEKIRLRRIFFVEKLCWSGGFRAMGVAPFPFRRGA
ncbi:hypothetical protein [Azospirillum argentinense]